MAARRAALAYNTQMQPRLLQQHGSPAAGATAAAAAGVTSTSERAATAPLPPAARNAAALGPQGARSAPSGLLSDQITIGVITTVQLLVVVSGWAKTASMPLAQRLQPSLCLSLMAAFLAGMRRWPRLYQKHRCAGRREAPHAARATAGRRPGMGALPWGRCRGAAAVAPLSA